MTGQWYLHFPAQSRRYSLPTARCSLTAFEDRPDTSWPAVNAIQVHLPIANANGCRFLWRTRPACNTRLGCPRIHYAVCTRCNLYDSRPFVARKIEERSVLVGIIRCWLKRIHSRRGFNLCKLCWRCSVISYASYILSQNALWWFRTVKKLHININDSVGLWINIFS